MQGQSVIESLSNRVSCGQLTEPGPDQRQLEVLLRVGTRAADHRALRPWRFILIRGDGLDRLGELFVEARTRGGEVELDDKQKEKLLAKPRRAPMILTAVAHVVDDPKVPEVEQVLSTGAALQNILNAAYAMGLGAMWRTGDLAYDSRVARGLGLAANERIVGFLYIGTPRTGLRNPPELDPADFVREWP